MKLFDTIRDIFRATKVPEDGAQPDAVGIKTVADYLKLVGMDIELSLHTSSSRFRGRLHDLSDDCRNLILTDLTEYDDSRAGSPAVDMKERELIPVKDVCMIRVYDTQPIEDPDYWKA
jgi:hypothetical protein